MLNFIMKDFTKDCGLQIQELLLLVGWEMRGGIKETLLGKIAFQLEFRRGGGNIGRD